MQSEHGTSLLTGSKCEDIFFYSATVSTLRKYLLHLFIFHFVTEVGLKYKYVVNYS